MKSIDGRRFKGKCCFVEARDGIVDVFRASHLAMVARVKIGVEQDEGIGKRVQNIYLISLVSLPSWTTNRLI